MAVDKTSLSAGSLIRELLLSDSEVVKRANKVFPIATSEAKLPYILYRRSRLSHDPVKQRAGADTVEVELVCYTEKYKDGLELAEAVRAALENKSYSSNGMTMRSCYLSDSSEGYDSDAFVQDLIFTIKI